MDGADDNTLPRPQCNLVSHATFPPRFAVPGQPGLFFQSGQINALGDDWVKIKALGQANFGRVILYQHTPSGMSTAIKRMANVAGPHSDGSLKNVGVIDAIRRQSEGENPAVEIGGLHFLTFGCANVQPRVGSQYLLRMLGIWMDGTYTYLASEVCPRGDLFEEVAASGRLGADRVRECGIQLLSAVQFMHHCGIAHRDISLENILIANDGTLRLMDMGMACAWANPTTGEERRFNSTVGKGYYRPPEMYPTFDPITKRREQPNYFARPCDVFSCGVCIYVCLNGKPLWDTCTPTDQVFKYIRANGYDAIVRTHWRLVPNPIPEQAWVLIKKLLSLDSRARPAAEDALKEAWFQ